MQLMLLRAFQRQVLLQCQFMLFAADEVNRALAAGEIERTFYGLQNLLNAAANISKVLWGQGGRFAAERRPLRASIGVNDDSPLSEVTMRNNFEHFDDRLDSWWRESRRHNQADLNIGPQSMISGLDDIDMFRSFDPGTGEVVFWGQAFSLQSLVAEAQRILPRVAEEAAKPHWEHPE